MSGTAKRALAITWAAEIRLLAVIVVLLMVCISSSGCATCSTRPGDKPNDQPKSDTPQK
jgi:hypothetical protein